LISRVHYITEYHIAEAYSEQVQRQFPQNNFFRCPNIRKIVFRIGFQPMKMIFWGQINPISIPLIPIHRTLERLRIRKQSCAEYYYFVDIAYCDQIGPSIANTAILSGILSR
jgi:hypothetical protein